MAPTVKVAKVKTTNFDSLKCHTKYLYFKELCWKNE